MKFEGIYTPAITPLGPDGQIDRKAFAEVLESLIEAGVHGIIVGGSTGEYYAHSAQERFDACGLRQGGDRHAAAAHRRHRRHPDRGLGRIRQGGKGDRRGRDPRHLAALCDADRARERGPRADDRPRRRPADHALQLSRPDGRLDGRGVFLPGRPVEERRRHQGELRRHGPDRICWPGRFPNIALSCGWDDQALEFFAWGARSWVCAGSNFLPTRACRALRGLRRSRRTSTRAGGS